MSGVQANEFQGLKGHFFAWFLTSPLRRVLEWKMGKPEDVLFSFLDLTGSEQVLDAGCGSGFHTLLMAKQLPEGRVVAVDVSEEMLARLEKNAKASGLGERIKTINADNLALPLIDGSMDRALAAAVWHHLSDPQGACNEMVRVLKPGGRVVVSDLLVGSEKAVRGLQGHDRAFLADDMRRIMAEAGLMKIQVQQVGRWLIGSGDKPS